jgi:hypothetical protein
MTWALLSSYHSSIVKVLGSLFPRARGFYLPATVLSRVISHLFSGIKPPMCCLKLRQYIGLGLFAVRVPCDCDGKALASTGSRFAVVIGLLCCETACSIAGVLFYAHPFLLSRVFADQFLVIFPATAHPAPDRLRPTRSEQIWKRVVSNFSFLNNLPFGETGSVSTQRAGFYHVGYKSQGRFSTNFQIGGTKSWDSMIQSKNKPQMAQIFTDDNLWSV